MNNTPLDEKALETAWKAVSGAGYKHLEPLVEDAIRAYLAATVADTAALNAEQCAQIAEAYDRQVFPGMEGVVNTTKKDIAYRIRKAALAQPAEAKAVKP